MSNANEDLKQWITMLLSEIERGEGLALAAAGRLFPAFRGSGSVGPSTVFRWVTKGTKSAGGIIVKLAAARVGSRWLTSRSAVTRFVAALTEEADPIPVPVSRTPSQQRKASEAAARKLEQMGA